MRSSEAIRDGEMSGAGQHQGRRDRDARAARPDEADLLARNVVSGLEKPGHEPGTVEIIGGPGAVAFAPQGVDRSGEFSAFTQVISVGTGGELVRDGDQDAADVWRATSDPR